MTRVRAASLHLGISALVAVVSVTSMILVWYPPPLFQLLGGFELLLLLTGVDVTLGPLLTFVVFKSGKKGLKFDLSVIAFLQLSAFIYGASVVFAARPGYIVFVKDRFEVVRVADVEPARLAEARVERFRSFPPGGPQFIGSVLPADPHEAQELLFSSLKGGADVPQLPKYYADLEVVRGAVVEKSQPLAELRKLNPQAVASIDRLPEALKRKESELGFLPLRVRRSDAAVIIDKTTGLPMKIVDLRPWK
ncbi:MAG TPA: TfpX/TfpZ family type IV pilin accessory protein [Burkholderiales bacterium]|nr:TfpX/TfpZ family type IV pilin accessory protein [Burkholderiales bacterium]